MNPKHRPMFYRPAVAAPPPAPGGSGFSVDFTLGADGDPLSGYAGWSPTADWAISDGFGTVTPGMKRTAGAGETVTAKDAGLYDGTFTLVLETDPSASVPYPAVYLRYTDINNFVRLVGSAGTNTWHVQDLRVGSTSAPGFDYDTGVAFTVGAVHTIAIVASGTSLQAKVAGVNAGVAQTQSSLTTATLAGFGINGTPAAYFRSIVVTA